MLYDHVKSERKLPTLDRFLPIARLLGDGQFRQL